MKRFVDRYKYTFILIPSLPNTAWLIKMKKEHKQREIEYN